MLPKILPSVLTMPFAVVLASLLFIVNLATAALPSYDLQIYKQGTWYTGIAMEDIDNDGGLEIIIGNRNTSSAEIWKYNVSTQTLNQTASISFPYHIHDIVAVDVDHDGQKEIIVGLRSYGLYMARFSGGAWNVTQIAGGRFQW